MDNVIMFLKKNWVLLAGGIFLILVVIFITIVIIRYQQDIQQAYQRLRDHQPNTVSTEFGVVSYLDEGSGQVVLISHGIFGGYDQGMNTLNMLLGDEYRKIAPSRFGYPGSVVPASPTPENQAKAFAQLLDDLEINQTFIITTSAGGAAGFQFAIQYPHHVNGLILLSSGMPTEKKTPEEITGMTGPPDFFVNDFPMWFSLNHLSFIMDMMFGATERPEDLYTTLLPVKPRREGIKIDETITNIDMDINFDSYPIETITIPILVVHAKDDPMARYENVEIFIERMQPQTAIFEDGGHLITGHDEEVSQVIIAFIEQNLSDQ